MDVLTPSFRVFKKPSAADYPEEILNMISSLLSIVFFLYF
jgi:hypothetical protein